MTNPCDREGKNVDEVTGLVLLSFFSLVGLAFFVGTTKEVSLS